MMTLAVIYHFTKFQFKSEMLKQNKSDCVASICDRIEVISEQHSLFQVICGENIPKKNEYVSHF